MTLNTKVRLLQAFNHVVAIFAVIFAVYTAQYYLFALALAVWFVIGPVSSVITLHRLLTHRSFKTYPWLEKVLSYVSVISTVGPTISWVALHRQHHTCADKEGDPHSPYVDNEFNNTQAAKVWLGYDWKVPNIPVRYVKDLLRSPTHKFIFNNYFKIIFAYAAVLLAIDPVLFLFAYVVPASLTVHLIGVVNVFGHRHGYRTHESNDKSTNSWIANAVSLGDGWHNNHHNNPRNYHAGEKWWEWDLMGTIIKGIKVD